MCSGALEDHLHPGESALDLGTGTGILAIAAAKLGAASVLALDVDAAAVRVAREHVAMNDVGHVVRVEQGSLEQVLSRTEGAATLSTHIVVANIATTVIVELLQKGLIRTLKTGGLFVASGILADQRAEAAGAMRAAGLEVFDQRQLGRWTAIISRCDIKPLRPS